MEIHDPDNCIITRWFNHFFPSYYAGTVIKEDALIKYPELKDILMLMDHLISDEEMAAKTEEFRQRLAQGETLDELLVEAMPCPWGR